MELVVVILIMALVMPIIGLAWLYVFFKYLAPAFLKKIFKDFDFKVETDKE